MHWLGHDIVERLVKGKQLNYGHVGVLLLLISRMDPNTGRVNVTATALAESMERDAQPVRQMVSGLLRHQLIARGRDEATGQRFFLIHPYIASVGGPQRRGFLWKQFTDAIDGRHIHPVPGDLEAA